MPAARIAFATPPHAQRWLRIFLYSPGARIVLCAVLTALLTGATLAAFTPSGWLVRATATPIHHAVADMVLRAVPALLAYLVVVLVVERRKPRELSPRDLPRYFLPGVLGGVLLFSCVAGLLWVLGSYHVLGVNREVAWLAAVLGTGIGAAIGEEVLLRGVVYRMVEEGLGSWWALAISALLFGGLHLANPGATWWSAIAIALEAGVLLALVYQVTRSLWACIGLHAAWNLTEGTLYGISVSGGNAHGLLVSKLTGPPWLSGGAFGAEASVVAVAVCLAASLALLAVARRRGQVVPPAWKRRAPPTLAAAAPSLP